MKRALITGSAGFVGGSFARRLVQDGWSVWGIDIRSDHGGSYTAADCRTFFDDRNQSPTRPFDLVIHAAANIPNVDNRGRHPLPVAENVALDLAALRWATQARPHHFVYFSSCAAYPADHTGELITETDIDPDAMREPVAMYGLAKLFGERAAAAARDEGVNVHMFRPFTGTGPTQSLNYPTPAICQRAATGENPLTVWSDSVRDIIHVDDVVNAVLAAVDADIPGPVNLCTGIATSFVELAEMAAHAAGYTGLVRILDGMPAGVSRRVGDPSLLHTFYKPAVTVEETVTQMVRHYQN